MSSQLMKVVRKTFGLKKVAKKPKVKYTQDGPIVSLTHRFYGPLKLLAEDQGISGYLFDGERVWEPDIVELFGKVYRRGGNIVDVGANLGLHSIALAKLAKGGEKVYALEPHPEIFPLTQYNCSKYKNIECIPKAASDCAAQFFMPSILKMENAGGVGLQTGKGEESLPVESISIDSLGLRNISLMKIDVEGHEIPCIHGAQETIRRERPILVVEIMGGHNVKTAAPEIADEIRRARISEICKLGYDATQVSYHDYLFQPRKVA